MTAIEHYLTTFPVMLKNSAGLSSLRVVNLYCFEVVEYSRKRIEDDQAVNGVKILRIPGHQRETTIESCGRDQRVWQSDAVLLPQRDRPLHYRLVKWDFLKVGEQAHRLLQLVRGLWIAQDFDPAITEMTAPSAIQDSTWLNTEGGRASLR
jgi:hypothetical protein